MKQPSQALPLSTVGSRCRDRGTTRTNVRPNPSVRRSWHRLPPGPALTRNRRSSTFEKSGGFWPSPTNTVAHMFSYRLRYSLSCSYRTGTSYTSFLSKRGCPARKEFSLQRPGFPSMAAEKCLYPHGERSLLLDLVLPPRSLRRRGQRSSGSTEAAGGRHHGCRGSRADGAHFCR